MSPTKRRLIIILATLLLVAMAPAVVMAAGGAFTDDDDSIFEPHIEWLASAGVTAGCNPPANDNFCPNDNVNRGQMAAFMRRFAQYIGAEDGTPAVADFAENAGTVDGLNGIDMQPARVSFEGNVDLVISTSGTQDVASVEITTAPTPICALGSFPDADILVRASASVNALSGTESATFWIEDSDGFIDGTVRWIAEPYGSMAVEWLYNGGGGTEEFTLVLSNPSGYSYNVRDAQITAELVQDTRCEFLVFTTIAPIDPAQSTEPATD